MSSPRVSVVVPCYNHGAYVERCLAAIDAQDYPDLEVIVVDDGSRDDSWARINAHRWRPGISVHPVRLENRGAHAALNHGLDLATGDFIALCNSDDYFAPARLRTLVERTQDAGARFAFSGVRFVDDAGTDVSEKVPYARDLVRRQAEIAGYPTPGFAIVLTNVAISTGNFFFARSLLEEIGYFRPYRYCHDWDFLLRALLVTEPLYVPEVLYWYRLHGQNSFTALDSAAAWECPELMRRFMRGTIAERHANRLAPSPRNWPGYFEYFVEEHHYQPYLVGWDGVDGVAYRPEPARVPLTSPEPHARFATLADPEWLEILVRSLDERTIDGVEMPAFPDEAIQVMFTSWKRRAALEEAYAFFRIVKAACERHGRPMRGDTQLLDFGVGWGRIARLFLKDIAGRNVFGVDVTASILEECRRLMPYGTYSLVTQGERLPFPDARFDVITAFSVFSHLSPEAHYHWLGELHRVLGRGGTLVFTTLPRVFLDRCVACAANPQLDDSHIGELVLARYPDWETRLRAFPDDEYLYLPTGGGFDALAPQHYGWAMVPKGYMAEHWSNEFEITEHVDDPARLAQAYFVLRKRG